MISWPVKLTVPLDRKNLELIILVVLDPIKLDIVKLPPTERAVMLDVKVVVLVVLAPGVPSDPI